MDTPPTTLARLPFATEAETGIDLWPFSATGDYAADCYTGRMAAHELITYIQERRAPLALGYVLKAIVERGRFGGHEIGFCQQLSENL